VGQSVPALAFVSLGNHIAFNNGEYDPSSAEGQHVIAHELAHVRQQTEGAVSMLPNDGIDVQMAFDPTVEQDQDMMGGGDSGYNGWRTPKSSGWSSRATIPLPTKTAPQSTATDFPDLAPTSTLESHDWTDFYR